MTKTAAAARRRIIKEMLETHSQRLDAHERHLSSIDALLIKLSQRVDQLQRGEGGD